MTLVFLSFGPFVEVLFLSISRIVTSILQGEQSRCLLFWWNSCYTVWFREVFLFPWILSFNIFFHLHLFDGVRFQYSQVLSPSVLIFPNFAVLFLLLLVFSPFSSLTRHIFLYQILSLCPDCIVLLFILLHFLQTVWCHSCILGSLSFLVI